MSKIIEWWDIDRSSKMPDEQSREKYDDILVRAKSQKWKFLPEKCPHCGQGAVVFEEPEDMADPDDRPCTCSWCDAQWNWQEPDAQA